MMNIKVSTNDVMTFEVFNIISSLCHMFCTHNVVHEPFVGPWGGT